VSPMPYGITWLLMPPWRSYIIHHDQSGFSCYHNPIFTPEIFSSVGTQNEETWTEPVRLDRDPPNQKSLETRPEAHFPEFEEV
jgi:hypothetical protein